MIGEKRKLEGAGDCGLAYRRMGEGAPIVLLHGWCLDRSMWIYAEEALCRSNDVIMVDLPGFGGSRAVDGPYDLAHSANLLRALLGELEVSRPTLAGFALGAAVAVELASRDSSNTKGVISIGLPSHECSPYGRMFDPIREDWPDFARRSASALFHARPSQATLDWIEALFSRTSVTVALEALSVLAEYDPRCAVAQVTVPQLFINAPNDRVAPPQLGEECASLAPHGSLKLMSHGGHFVPFEAKNEMHDAIIQFVNSEAPAGGNR